MFSVFDCKMSNNRKFPVGLPKLLSTYPEDFLWKNLRMQNIYFLVLGIKFWQVCQYCMLHVLRNTLAKNFWKIFPYFFFGNFRKVLPWCSIQRVQSIPLGQKLLPKTTWIYDFFRLQAKCFNEVTKTAFNGAKPR